MLLRRPTETTRRGKGQRGTVGRTKDRAPPIALDEAALARFAELKAWRAEVARELNLPAYVVFHDVTPAEMARVAPGTLAALGEISGVGAKKLEAYGHAILKVLAG